MQDESINIAAWEMGQGRGEGAITYLVDRAEVDPMAADARLGIGLGVRWRRSLKSLHLR